MQKKFISNLVLMVVLNLLVKPIAIFGIDATVQNRVGAEEYGTYFALLNFSFLFNILLDLGINNFTTKSIAQYPQIAAKYLGKILVFRLVLFIFYAVFSFTMALVLGWGTREIYLLSFLIINQFIVTLIAYTRSHFGGLLLFKTEAFIGVLDRILLIVFCGILLYTPIVQSPFKIEWFIWIQTFCYSIAFIISIIILIKKVGIPKLKFQPVYSYAIIRKSFPYALLILLMMIYTRIDSVMIERINVNGKAEAGYYAQGFRLLNILFMFAMLFSNLLFPIFSKMIKKKEDVVPLFSTASKLLIGGAIFIAILSYFNGEYILGLIYNNDVAISSPSFRLLMISFIGMCSTIIFGTLLTARGDLRFLNSLSIIGIIVNVSINLYLIPIQGAQGAALATVVTQSLISAIQFIYCMKVLEIKFSLITSGQITLYTLLILTFCYYVRAESILLLIGIFTFSFISMFVFKLIDYKSLFKVLKSS